MTQAMVDEKAKSRIFRIRVVKYFAFAFLILLIFGFGSFLYVAWNLPSVQSLENFSPPLATEVYGRDKIKIGEFYKERRYFLPFSQIPPLVSKAFIAAEDAEFYQHKGVSFTGIFRAFVKNLEAGKIKQGGSTITQQVAKSLLLSPERSLTRKAREAILAFKMESFLTKENILEIYLNQIYLGNGAYGVAAAAQAYFGKDISELSIAEVAMIAGLTKAPGRDNPFQNFEGARERQLYVLLRMKDEHFISEEEYALAQEEGISVVQTPNINLQYAPYFVEEVRRELFEKLGGSKVLEGGLQVYTTIEAQTARFASDALRQGLEELDQRQGYRGPIRKVKSEDWPAITEELQEKIPEDGSIHEGFFYEALVTETNDKKGYTLVQMGGMVGAIPMETMRWARAPDPEKYWEYHKIDYPSQALQPGDLIVVKLLTDEKLISAAKLPEGHVPLLLAQEPRVQGAIISLDPRDGSVRAMVGGFDFEKSEFNRSIQAKRQPGSAFKPIVYSAALDAGYTAASVIVDSPIVYEDHATGFRWTPKNFSGKFQGDTVFRECLIKSLNVPTVKIMRDIGVESVLQRAKSLGISSPLTRDESLALGSSAVTPLELTQAYSAFASGGKRVRPFWIERIVDSAGVVLHREDVSALDVPLQDQIRSAQTSLDSLEEKWKAEEVGRASTKGLPEAYAIRPQTAFIMTHLLTEVVNYGTGRGVLALGRPAAGKTGTTNDNYDAWFVGYTPNLVAAVWVGFDASEKLGVREVGGHAASPIWLSYMKEALAGKPTLDFEVPRGIVFAKIDGKTGKLATNKTEEPIFEAFLEGSVPLETTEEEAKKKSSQEFFLQE